MSKDKFNAQIRQFKLSANKPGIRISLSDTEKLVNSLKELFAGGLSIESIDKVIQKILKDTNFRAAFLSDFKGAVKTLGYERTAQEQEK